MKGLRFDSTCRELTLESGFFDGPVWRCGSRMAVKLYLWLAFKAMHPRTDVNGLIVEPGQYCRSIAQLARDLGARDWRVARDALIELEQADAIILLRKTSEAPTKNAGGSCENRPTKNAGLFRGPQLISIRSFNELLGSPAKNVEAKRLLRSLDNDARRAGTSARARSDQPEAERKNAEEHLFALARMRSERTGVSLDEARAAVLEERPEMRRLLA